MDAFLAKISSSFNLTEKLQPLGGECDLNFLSADAKGSVIVKIMREACEPDFIEMQIAAIAHALKQDPELPLPEIIAGPTVEPDPQGIPRFIWLQRALDGKPMGDIAPQGGAFFERLGRMAGRLNKALADFNHPQLDRANKWHMLFSEWVEVELPIIKEPRRALLQNIMDDFRKVRPILENLPRQAIHNDLNDWNILISTPLNQPPRLSGLIDFGDMCRAPIICDLAIAGAYALMRQGDIEQALAALVKGFHATCPLTQIDLELLWLLIKVRLTVSVVNAAIESTKSPGELYVTISERGAWEILENEKLNENRLLARLRHACGLPVHPQAPAIATWLKENRNAFHPILSEDVKDYPLADFSVEKCLWPENPFEPRPLTDLRVAGVKADKVIGRYGEPRLAFHRLLLTPSLATAPQRPTVSLGVDVFALAGQAVHAPVGGIVSHIDQDENGLQVTLRHDTPVGSFFTRWDHLSHGAKKLAIGAEIKVGEAFATLASAQANGGWRPHVFVQMSFVEPNDKFWVTAASADDLAFFQTLFSSPAALLGLDEEQLSFPPLSQAELLEFRQSHFAANLKLSYRAPVMFVRGWRHHLFDVWGRPFLDAYNNVPHVGHAHPRIRRVVCEQLGRMNSNTRYLHPAQKAFAEKLIGKMPVGSGLEVCFFVNSGSEANELALRLARAATGGYDMITPDHGYHGNTTGAIDISAYKFNKPGMGGRKEWVHLVDVADDYRGRFRENEPDPAALYAAQIDEALMAIEERGGRLAGFIAETFPSVGGQIIPPKGYLQQVYMRIREAGGICIADEVQTGLGRLGEYYFAFEQQQVVPDIVVLGKPIGNGHPLAALITTQEIAEKFSQGAEYFSTFGGSTLSCLIGREVLDIVDEEGLADNAARMGCELLSGLRQLQTRHQAIGEVRGLGLFIGVDLVEDRVSRKPATALAEHVTNHLRDEHILIGREGSADNILKIRPPLTIDSVSIERICAALDAALHSI